MIETKERSIIFRREQVFATLKNRMRQTRRVIKPQPDEKIYPIEKYWRDPFTGYTFSCPYGQIGDILWVQESWRVHSWHEGWPMEFEYKDGKIAEENVPIYRDIDAEEWFWREWERISDELIDKKYPEDEDGLYSWKRGQSPLSWRSPIYMPRWASRIDLEITNVRVERLQDISDKDAMNEGVYEWYTLNELDSNSFSYWNPINGSGASQKFSEIWNKLNSKREFSWSSNPWVWVIEFKLLEDRSA